MPEMRKQPKLLYLLSFIEMCERFSHYTMRAILLLYMAKILLLSNNHSYTIFAGFFALLYFTPFVGGYLADKTLGLKNAVLFGGVLITIGYTGLIIPGMSFFYYSLAFIAIGSGFFIPSLSGVVGQLYEKNDFRRDGGFSIYYAAINLGGLIPPLIIGMLIAKFGWHAGFILAAIITFLSTLIFYFCVVKKFELHNFWKLICGTFLLIAATALLIKHAEIINKIIFILGTLFFLYVFKRSFNFQNKKLHICFFLILFSIIFETLLQQTAMSMTIFVDSYVNRNFINFSIPTVAFQSLNPFFVICFAPLISFLWSSLAKRNIRPSVSQKFACGTLLMGLGFVIFPYAILMAHGQKINFIWIILSYSLQSVGELLVTPVGMAMITEASPPAMLGFMMGLLYFSYSVGSALAGIFSQLTEMGGADGRLMMFAKTYGELGMAAVLTGLMILFLAIIFGNFMKQSQEKYN